MKTKWKLFLLTMVGTLGLACAHSQKERDLDRRVASETTVSTYADLRSETAKAIASSSNLTAEQRSRLMALREETRAKLDSAWQETLKLRSVLIKDMLAANYNEDEVEAIKARMRKSEDVRLAAIFDAIKQANSIMGRQATQNPRVISGFLEDIPRSPGE